MDPIAIILTIAACIGGLLAFAFILFLVAAHNVKKIADHDPWSDRINRPRIRR